LTNFSGGLSSANAKARGAVHAAIASAATQKKYRRYERIHSSHLQNSRDFSVTRSDAADN
jgi:hypothetical protein